jgi:predicted RNA-binding protein YlxR (DUF448 family)
MQIVPGLDPNMVPELKARQVTGQGAAVAATAITQVPPVTTYTINVFKNGVPQLASIPYTQTFVPIPDQWPGPTVGTIGLGTIQGAVGVVKTKRSLPTQAPIRGRIDFGKEADLDAQADHRAAYILEKMKKIAQTVHSEIAELLCKEKKQPTTRPEVMEKAKETETGLASKTGARQAEQLVAAAASDAQVLKAGTLAVLAVSIGTICMGLV